VDISGVISHDLKFCGGVLASNGHIIFVPYDANSLGDFDPATVAFSTISIVHGALPCPQHWQTAFEQARAGVCGGGGCARDLGHTLVTTLQ